MSLLLSLLLSLNSAYAADPEWAILPKAAPVYAQPNAEANVLGVADLGEKIAVRKRGKTFSRVQFKREGKWKAGYVMTADLSPDEKPAEPRGLWGVGGGGDYTYLRHAGKNFETDDQVKYSTEIFTSASLSPFILIQYDQRDFWRFIFTYRLTDYSSSAMTDVPGAVPRKLSLQHTMLSGTLQRMWTPFKTPAFYFGLGIEISRATKADLILGNIKLPVNSQDLPTYFGGHGAFGWQFDFFGSVTAFTELRAVGYFNQSPMVLGAEVALGLLYWP